MGASDLTIELDYDCGLPIYRQIEDQIRAALEDGRLQVDDQLPTIHALARELDINPNTVARAYRDLEQTGYLVGKRGKGTFPAPRAVVEKPDKAQILERIFQRALEEAERFGISQRELAQYFRR